MKMISKKENDTKYKDNLKNQDIHKIEDDPQKGKNSELPNLVDHGWYCF